MNKKQKEFRDRLKTNSATSKSNSPNNINGFDMQKYIAVTVIDDDEYMMKLLENRFTNVYVNTEDIDSIARYISKNTDGIFHLSDMIFIDTLYRDDKSNLFAIDFFNMYRNMNPETKKETDGKYHVVIGIDDLNEAINKTENRSMAQEEHEQEMSQLLYRARKNPCLEWGINIGSKVEVMAQAIQEYANKNKIYLYRNDDISLQEWKEYIICYTNKLIDIVERLQETTISVENRDKLSSIISQFNIKIDYINSLLEISESKEKQKEIKIMSIKEAMDCLERLNLNSSALWKQILTLGIEEKNNKIKNISHDFNHILTHSDRLLKKERKKADKKAIVRENK